MLSPAMKTLGFGLGLRPDHYDAILSERPDVGFFEALTENYLVPGGKALHYLERIRSDYPIVLHGVSLSIGSTEPLNREYLRLLKGKRTGKAPVSASVVMPGCALNKRDRCTRAHYGTGCRDWASTSTKL